MTQVMEPEQHYVSEFDPFLARAASNGREWTAPIRKNALEKFETLGFPTTKNEQWLHTSVKSIQEANFRLASAPELTADESSRIDALDLGRIDAHRVIFVDGHFYPSLSEVGELPPGVKIGGLSEAMESDRAFIESHLTKTAPIDDQPFAALNTAYMQDGAVIFVPRGVTVERPIYLLFVTTKACEGAVSHPRLLTVIENGAQASVIERYVALASVHSFTNAVAEIVIGDNAHLKHYKINQESDQTAHISGTQITQGRDSHYDSTAITLSGAFVRNFIGGRLDGPGIESNLNGLYVVDGKRHFDTHTFLDHAEPNCQSNELYKGILDDEASAVFNGKIYVRRKAQKTNAFQANRNLLLSESAKINTEPQLEIFADDVRCTHGSTVGQMDREALFYLKSRGISAADAYAMLTDSFAGEILDLIKVEPVRNYLRGVLYERFHKRQMT